MHSGCRLQLQVERTVGEPLIQQAIDAIREYHRAQDCGASPEEIERLRLLAESLFPAVADYQLRVVARARGKDLPLSTEPSDGSCLTSRARYTMLYLYTVLVPYVLPSRSTPRAWRGPALRPSTESPATPRGRPHRRPSQRGTGPGIDPGLGV